jgi:hypothetical protein
VLSLEPSKDLRDECGDGIWKITALSHNALHFAIDKFVEFIRCGNIALIIQLVFAFAADKLHVMVGGVLGDARMILGD